MTVTCARGLSFLGGGELVLGASVNSSAFAVGCNVTLVGSHLLNVPE